MSADVYVDCVTEDETATADLDYLPRVAARDSVNGRNQANRVKIAAGEMYGFCDIEIVDDDLNEAVSETFRAVLVSPSTGSRVGAKSEATVLIIGPNDCK